MYNSIMPSHTHKQRVLDSYSVRLFKCNIMLPSIWKQLNFWYDLKTTRNEQWLRFHYIFRPWNLQFSFRWEKIYHSPVYELGWFPIYVPKYVLFFQFILLFVYVSGLIWRSRYFYWREKICNNEKKWEMWSLFDGFAKRKKNIRLWAEANHLKNQMACMIESNSNYIIELWINLCFANCLLFT